MQGKHPETLTDMLTLRVIDISGQIAKETCGRNFLETGGIDKVTATVSQVRPGTLLVLMTFNPCDAPLPRHTLGMRNVSREQ